MFTQYTYNDWLTADDRLDLLLRIITAYKASREFRYGLLAQKYFRGANEEVLNKMLIQAKPYEVKDEKGRVSHMSKEVHVRGAQLPTNFFRRAVLQQNQYLLGNGVTLDKAPSKEKLGFGFDKALESVGKHALVQGVCWGYWNNDHLEVFPAAVDDGSGFFALLDEMTGTPMLGIQFWQIDEKRPMYVRLFEVDGVTVYIKDKDSANLTEHTAKRAYKQTVSVDAAGERLVDAQNYSALPVIPLFANDEQESELRPSIKEKIDAYDRIFSDFGDNLDRANDVYWVLNNFGGNIKDALEITQQIQQLKLILNQTDGTGSGSTAAPHTIEVPYQARQTALEILRKELYADFMALDMDALTGGSLTNVAIKAAMVNLDLKANDYEWQCFRFVQNVLALNGIKTEDIQFKRQTLVNSSEMVADISLMRDYIDQETALKINPYIEQEEIPEILKRLAAESMSAAPDLTEDPTETEEKEEDDA